MCVVKWAGADIGVQSGEKGAVGSGVGWLEMFPCQQIAGVPPCWFVLQK